MGMPTSLVKARDASFRAIWIPPLIAACLLAAVTPLHGYDPSAPATIVVTIIDQAGKPVEGATVEVRPSMPPAPVDASAKSGKDGKATLRVKASLERRGGVRLAAIADGCVEADAWLDLFPEGKFEQTLRLEPAGKTTILLCDPQGRPVAHQELEVRYYVPRQWQADTRWRLVTTGADGRAELVHGAMEGLSIEIRDAGPVKIETSDGRAKATLSPSQMRHVAANGRIEAKLLDKDDKPAAGWQVAVENPSNDGSYEMRFDKPLTLGADGRFVLDKCHRFIWAKAPQGHPLLFEVQPPEAGKSRDLVLREPPVRRMHRAQLVWEGGRPVSAFIEPSVFLRGRLGERDSRVPPPVWNAGTSTDAKGWVQVPLYYGQACLWSGGELPRALWAFPSRQKHEFRRMPQVFDPPPTDPKKITIITEGPDGKPVHGLHYSRRSAGCVVMNEPYCRGVSDARGSYVLVPKETKRLNLDAWPPDWAGIDANIELKTDGDETVTVKIPEGRKMLRRIGRVLDENGRPAEGVAVTALGEDRASASSITDHLGRFEFYVLGRAALSMQYKTSTAHYDVTSLADGTWLDADQAECTIRLGKRTSVTVLLPESAQPEAQLALVPVTGTPTPPDERPEHIWLHLDKQVPAAVAHVIQPGKYRLMPLYRIWPDNTDGIPRDLTGRAPELVSMDLEIKPGPNTLDLRKHKLTLPILPAGRCRVTVRQDGKAVAGAVISLSSTPAVPTDDLVQAVKNLTATSIKQRQEAQARLLEAGYAGLGTAIAHADLDDLEVAARCKELLNAVNLHPVQEERSEHEPPRYLRRLVMQVARDVSDSAGRSSLQIEAGRRYVVVARLPGKAIGLTSFVAVDGGEVTVDLKPSCTLTVQTPLSWLKEQQADQRVRLSIKGPKADEAAALMLALGMKVDSGTLQPTGCLLQDLDGRYVAEDLPRGLECHLQGMSYIYPLSSGSIKLDQNKSAQSTSLPDVKE